eukprot:scaffold124971_cov72-Phaeocystis_antarctica.AAC.2
MPRLEDAAARVRGDAGIERLGKRAVLENSSVLRVSRSVYVLWSVRGVEPNISYFWGRAGTNWQETPSAACRS